MALKKLFSSAKMPFEKIFRRSNRLKQVIKIVKRAVVFVVLSRRLLISAKIIVADISDYRALL